MKDLYLHRYSDPEKRWHSAMTAAVDGMAATDNLDLGLAALVGLLNERADDRLRQVLRPRLPLVLNTGRTALALLIAEIFMPSIIHHCGYAAEANLAGHWRELHDAAEVYRRLGARFTKTDGRAVLVSGCMALAAAMEAKDPLTQDILAVSAAGEVVPFEATEGWSQLFHILDYVIGVSDIRPYVGQPEGREITTAMLASEGVPTGLFEGLPDQPTSHEAANFFGELLSKVGDADFRRRVRSAFLRP